MAIGKQEGEDDGDVERTPMAAARKGQGQAAQAAKSRQRVMDRGGWRSGSGPRVQEEEVRRMV